MKISRYIFGYVVINISGASIEEFTNGALKQGIPLWDIERVESNLYRGKVPVGSLNQVRVIAHQAGVFVTVAASCGLPEMGRLLKRYRLPIVILLFTLVFLVLYCQCIIGVKVVVDGELVQGEEQAILSIAKKYDIAPGFWRRNLDWEQAAHEIMTVYPQLAWVGFERTGVIIHVEVVVKDKVEKDETLAGDVVAKKDGFVKSILVLRGKAQVEPETAVKKGDILISGEVTYEDEEGNTTSEPSYVHAKGLVAGSVWYIGEAEVGLQTIEPIPTGESTAIVTLHWQGKDYLLWGSEEKTFADYQETLHTYTWGKGASITLKNQNEVKPKIVILSEKEALEKGKYLAYQRAIKALPQKAIIGHKQVEVLDDGRQKGLIKVRVTVESHESLGVFQGFAEDF